ncbi:nSTAND1 domain-containing NTPase [Pedobacter paludis]|uniref:Novel STAND NTPase 1 domain-containing protein n=1 Tax=Pedobacter paludis TaxID=2203212 RepID=A0A317F2A2_9SPHI|nr:AAA family ATPase [Pedobacter paludis]PWS33360.1 hypothetical protein DF947_01670 [Pedobacter paludis]
METTKTYPFKFLDAYTREDEAIFHGRKEEIDQLYEMVFVSNLVLVYGASGTGKTSLIQCGLASRFESHDWLDLTVRWNKNILYSLRQIINQAMVQQEISSDFRKDSPTTVAKASNKPKSFVEEDLKALFLGCFKPIYLIFDQFEELFILGNTEEQEKFSEELIKLLELDIPLKMIFCIREEYLGHLAPIEKQIPHFMSKKLRLEPIGIAKTHDILTKATAADSSNISIPKEKAKEICQSIFDKVKGKENSLYIQLPYLQVYLNELFERIQSNSPNDKTYVFSLDEIQKSGNIEDVLREFLEDEVASLRAKVELDQEQLWSILSYFVSLEGTKEPISKEKLNEAFEELGDKVHQVISSLISKKILREIEDGTSLELSHDSLAQKIAEKRSEEDIAQLEIRSMLKGQVAMSKKIRELFSEEKLVFMQQFLPTLQKRQLIDKASQALIDDSWKKISEEKEKKEAAERQAFADEQKALADEKAKNQILENALMKNKLLSKLVSVVAVLAIICAVFTLYFYRENQRKIDAIERSDRMNTAKKLKESGDGYKDVESFADAKDSYQKALDTIANYPNEPLYKELEKLVKE